VELLPRNAFAYNARGEEWNLLRELKKAIDDQTRAIEILPGEASFYMDRGYVLWHTREYDRAIGDFTRAIELKPGYSWAYFRRGVVYTDKRDYGRAIENLTKAIELEPGPLYYSCRGRAYHFNGDYGNAVQDYTKVISIASNADAARKFLAWLRATCPDEKYRDGPKAVELAESAVKMRRWPVAGYQDVLAAAYAQAGRFGDAVKAQQKAIELLEERLSKESMSDEIRRRWAPMLPKYKERLKSYRAKKPWRERSVPGF
jgi:tetratricopeptide (TPR) repeat protein